MIYVLTNNLNINEVYVLERIMKQTNYPYYRILDMSKEADKVEREDLLNAKIILVFKATKGVSAFEKKLLELYGDIREGKEDIVRIDTPSVFNADKNLIADVWQKITSLCQIKVQKVDVELIPQKIPPALLEMVNGNSEKKAYILSDGKFELEIRPDEFPASRQNSLTYSEFLIIISAKSLFRFNKLEIISKP